MYIRANSIGPGDKPLHRAARYIVALLFRLLCSKSSRQFSRPNTMIITGSCATAVISDRISCLRGESIYCSPISFFFSFFFGGSVDSLFRCVSMVTVRIQRGCFSRFPPLPSLYMRARLELEIYSRRAGNYAMERPFMCSLSALAEIDLLFVRLRIFFDKFTFLDRDLLIVQCGYIVREQQLLIHM